MICLLDIDGVVGNFAERTKIQEGIDIEPRKLLPQDTGFIRTLKDNPEYCKHFVLGMNLYWYVPDLLQVLNRNFEKILICSKPLSPAYEAARFEWVKNKLGEKYARNFIFSVKQKELFACSSSFLIDDMKANCRQFKHSGGYSLHWHEEDFEEMINQIYEIRNEMSNNFMKKELVKLENIK
jgi:hypothetical protein